jgi:hypothetical protein
VCSLQAVLRRTQYSPRALSRTRQSGSLQPYAVIIPRKPPPTRVARFGCSTISPQNSPWAMQCFRCPRAAGGALSSPACPLLHGNGRFRSRDLPAGRGQYFKPPTPTSNHPIVESRKLSTDISFIPTIPASQPPHSRRPACYS